MTRAAAPAAPLPAPGPGTEPPPRGLLGELSKLDRHVYETVARQHTPALDRPLRILSQVANKSVLWGVIAATLAAVGGTRGRKAASQGVSAIGVTSALCNLGLKPLYRRHRPRRLRRASTEGRLVPMPTSSSFPSGHSASAFAFATAVGIEIPLLSLPLHALAAVVAYSRLHTGVHYPGDVIAGAVVGIATGQVVTRMADRLWREGVATSAGEVMDRGQRTNPQV